MNKKELLELAHTLRVIAEENDIFSFEQWHEDGWLNCKFRYKHGPKPPPPEPRKVPLGPDDVPPGSVFSKADFVGWYAASELGSDSVKLGVERLAFTWLMRHNWQIKRPTDTEWQPCYKEVSE